MSSLILITLFSFSLILNGYLVIVLRGVLRSEESLTDSIRSLTGREIEELHQKVNLVGLNGLSKNDVLSMIKTVKSCQLGTYVDTDPYVPADPYVDLDEGKN